MESNKNCWTLGEIATLPRMEKPIKTSGLTAYERYIGSRYICIREESDGQRGILMKVLGKVYYDQIKMVGGEPFSKDDRDEDFVGRRYFSYPFPNSIELKEVLDILRGNDGLLRKFEDAKMHVNPNSMFWVNESSRNMFMMKTPQVYGSSDGQLSSPSDDTPYYRVSMVYFSKGELHW